MCYSAVVNPMMRSLVILLPGMLAVASAEDEQTAAPLTLDPGLYAEALREVQGVAPAAIPNEGKGAQKSAEQAVSSAPGAEDWQAAMRDAGTELADVRLLVLLQRLNPLEPPASRAEDYAEALRLHHLMLAGNARACLALAAACRAGKFESGLHFIQSDLLAEVLERRASAFQLAPSPSPRLRPGVVQQGVAAPAADAGE